MNKSCYSPMPVALLRSATDKILMFILLDFILAGLIHSQASTFREKSDIFVIKAVARPF